MFRQATLLAALTLLSLPLVTAAADPKLLTKTGADPPGYISTGHSCPQSK